MNKTKIIAATAALLFGAPSVAQAETYLSKGQARASAESYVEETYGSTYPGAWCRPQGLNRAAPGYSYRRWVCYWTDEYKCEGKLLIEGARGRGYYRAKVLRGQRCP